MCNPISLRKESVTLDLEVGLVVTFRIYFVIGILAILFLYFLFGRGTPDRHQDRGRNEGESAQHEHQSEEQRVQPKRRSEPEA